MERKYQRICSIVGARPQFIKVSAIAREVLRLKNLNVKVEHIIIHSGQHFDNEMSNAFFSQLDIPSPNINLRIGGGTHGENTGKMIEAIEKTLIEYNPTHVFLYGDTDTTLAGSIAASKLNMNIAHIESGLRSWNRQMPEEINRILTDHCSDILFCSTETALQNLKREGIASKKIKLVGDVMYDNFIHFRKLQTVPKVFEGQQLKNFIFCTIHRAENTNSDYEFNKIIELLNTLGVEQKIIFPLHPRTKRIIEDRRIKLSGNIITMKPLDMFETFWALEKADLVITDSGGLQKEAFFAKKKCITLRSETEWIELVEMGVNLLVPPRSKNKLKKIRSFIKTNPMFTKKPFGLGDSSKKILKAILKFH